MNGGKVGVGCSLFISFAITMISAGYLVAPEFGMSAALGSVLFGMLVPIPYLIYAASLVLMEAVGAKGGRQDVWKRENGKAKNNEAE